MHLWSVRNEYVVWQNWFLISNSLLLNLIYCSMSPIIFYLKLYFLLFITGFTCSAGGNNLCRNIFRLLVCAKVCPFWRWMCRFWHCTICEVDIAFDRHSIYSPGTLSWSLIHLMLHVRLKKDSFWKADYSICNLMIVWKYAFSIWQ